MIWSFKWTSERIIEHTVCTSNTVFVSVVNMYKKNNEPMCSWTVHRKCSVVFRMISWHCTHIHLYPHVLNVLVQYLTLYLSWILSMSSQLTWTWCYLILVQHVGCNMRLAKCKQNKYLCCESQPHTHTHPVTPTHAHTHMHICVYTQEGFLPLHNASGKGYDVIVEMLLQAGATVNLQQKVEDCYYDSTLFICHL